MSLLENLPAENKYETIKAHIKEMFGLSESECARQLLSLPGLGDSRHSVLMDHMMALLGDLRPCFLLKELFLQQLPNNVRLAVTNSVKSDYRQLAREADLFLSAGKKCCVAMLANCPTATRDKVEIRPDSVTAVAGTRRMKQPGLCSYDARFGIEAK